MVDSLRIDKWLWFARFCKSRSLAKTMCISNKVSVNGTKVQKPNFQIRKGDRVVISYRSFQRDIVVAKFATRRDSAECARYLYEEVIVAEDPTLGRRAAAPIIRSSLGRPSRRELQSLAKYFGNRKFY